MSRPINIEGEVFGRLTAVSRKANTKQGKTTWLCLCSCGNSVVAVGANLKNGFTNSCGCLRKEVTATRTNRGYITKHAFYRVWQGLIKRCYQKTSVSYRYYGLKGIRVCQQWRESFQCFAKDMGERPFDENGIPFDIDRMDSSKDYEPDNCRWLSKRENSQRAMAVRWGKK